MRNAVRKVVVVGALDLSVSEALRELGWRADAVPGASVLELSRTLRAQKPRVVHVRESHLAAALLSRLSGLPVVLEVAPEQLSAATGVVTRLADRVICGGAALREALVARGAPASATMVQRGLAPPAPTALAMFPAFLDPGLRWVVCPAPHDGQDRGVADALLAFAALARTRPRIGLLVNARGSAARGLLAQADAAGLRGRVVVRALSRDELRGAFAHAAAVVGPSRSASLPDYLPEALAAGAAIVATAVGPHPGWVREGRTGFLVPARAPVALSARLGSLLDDRVLASRIREGARRSAEEAASPRARALELSRCYGGVLRPAPVSTGILLPAPVRWRT
jgi:Glycosyl transferases group 1